MALLVVELVECLNRWMRVNRICCKPGQQIMRLLALQLRSEPAVAAE